jgi:hypothetical protein
MEPHLMRTNYLSATVGREHQRLNSQMLVNALTSSLIQSKLHGLIGMNKLPSLTKIMKVYFKI